MPEVGIVLLAAGRGARFGPEPKLLGLLDGKPLVRHAGEAAAASSLRPIVAVLGAHGDAVRAALDGLDIALIDNPRHAEGLSTSLRAGLAALPAAIDAAIVMLGDMPRVAPAHLCRLAEAFRAAEPAPAAIVPTSGGRRGNPVLLNLRLLGPALAAIAGDQGAGRLLAAREDIVEIEMGAAVTLDIDTPAALAEAAEAAGG